MEIIDNLKGILIISFFFMFYLIYMYIKMCFNQKKETKEKREEKLKAEHDYYISKFGDSKKIIVPDALKGKSQKTSTQNTDAKKYYIDEKKSKLMADEFNHKTGKILNMSIEGKKQILKEKRIEKLNNTLIKKHKEDKVDEEDPIKHL